MKMLVLSDIHGKIDGLESLKAAAQQADMLVVNGDLTHFGGRKDALRVIEELKKLHSTIYAVPGNCDNEEVASVISSEGINIDGSLVKATAHRGDAAETETVALYGIGGALPGPVSTPNEYSEEELEEMLSRVPTNESEPLLLVCHQPPHNSVADRVMKVKHVGSGVLRRWIDSHAALLILTGHIHESRGYDWYGETCVVNPGAFKEGRYAEVSVDTENRTVEVELF